VDPSTEAATAGAPINLNIVTPKRGARALQMIDVDGENTPQVFTPARGKVTHKRDKAPRVTLHENVIIYSVTKVDLTRLCRTRASSAGVRFY
jgi:hypothetical protein